VIEFGAGKEFSSGIWTNRAPTPRLTSVDRGPGTIVCDLNQRPLPVLGVRAYDVAVLMGVLEYIATCRRCSIG